MGIGEISYGLTRDHAKPSLTSFCSPNQRPNIFISNKSPSVLSNMIHYNESLSHISSDGSRVTYNLYFRLNKHRGEQQQGWLFVLMRELHRLSNRYVNRNPEHLIESIRQEWGKRGVKGRRTISKCLTAAYAKGISFNSIPIWIHIKDCWSSLIPSANHRTLLSAYRPKKECGIEAMYHA